MTSIVARKHLYDVYVAMVRQGCLRSYGFPSNKSFNIWACPRYGKYPSGIIDSALGATPLGRYQ